MKNAAASVKKIYENGKDVVVLGLSNSSDPMLVADEYVSSEEAIDEDPFKLIAVR